MTLANATQDQYYEGSTKLLMSRNVLSYVKGDLIDILRTDPRAKEDTDLYELVHAFNEMYHQFSLITENKERKAHGYNTK
jgi:hypothetical protein